MRVWEPHFLLSLFSVWQIPSFAQFRFYTLNILAMRIQLNDNNQFSNIILSPLVNVYKLVENTFVMVLRFVYTDWKRMWKQINQICIHTERKQVRKWHR